MGDNIDLTEVYERHREKWVVLDKWTKDYRVVCVGDHPKSVVEKAKEQGAEDPVVLYVPKEQMNWIFKLGNETE